MPTVSQLEVIGSSLNSLTGATIGSIKAGNPARLRVRHSTLISICWHFTNSSTHLVAAPHWMAAQQRLAVCAAVL
jgi:hypothetical protein